MVKEFKKKKKIALEEAATYQVPLYDSILFPGFKIIPEKDANTGNKRALTPLQGQFVREKTNLEKLLAELYNLGSEDSLIPLIKELYEAN